MERLGAEVVADDLERGLDAGQLVRGQRRAAVAVDAAAAEARAEVAREGRVEERVGDEDVVDCKHGAKVGPPRGGDARNGACTLRRA